jgi:hypothetical protein
MWLVIADLRGLRLKSLEVSGGASEVEVWLPDSWWAGVAEDVSGIEDRLPILRQVLIASGFAAPMMGVEPKTMSDADVLAIVEEDNRK